MYALTVNDIDAQTYARINCIAAEEELSPSQVLLRLIRSALKQESKILKAERVRPISPRVHALRGIVHLPEDFDERKFKSERLTNRLEI